MSTKTEAKISKDWPIHTKREANSERDGKPGVADCVWVEENRTDDGCVLNNTARLCPIFTERSHVVPHWHAKITARLQTKR